MSAINRMLLDLERRGSSLEIEGSSGGVLPVPGTRPPGWRAAGGGLLLAVAAAALAAALPGAGWKRFGAKPPMPPEAAVRQVSAPISGAGRREPHGSEAVQETPALAVPDAPEAPASPQPGPERLESAKAPAIGAAKARVEPAASLNPAPDARDKPAPARNSQRAPAPAAEGAPASREDPAGEATIEKRMKELTPRQQAETEFRRAVGLMRQGRLEEAREGCRSVLRTDPAHGTARQTLAALLVEARQVDEAERVLAEGMRLTPLDLRVALALARVQVSRGALEAAQETLKQAEAQGANDAEYHAFVGTVLQRLSRHGDAIPHYAAALNLAPNSGVWFMGLGISLQAEGRMAEAREAYRRARETENLSPELVAFVDQRLGELPPAGR